VEREAAGRVRADRVPISVMMVSLALPSGVGLRVVVLAVLAKRPATSPHVIRATVAANHRGEMERMRVRVARPPIPDRFHPGLTDTCQTETTFVARQRRR